MNSTPSKSPLPASLPPVFGTARAALRVAFYGPTNTRGARLKVETQRGSAFFPYPHELNRDEAFHSAAAAMLARFAAEDAHRYGPDAKGWGTLAEFVPGWLPDGSAVYVWAGRKGNT